VRRRAVAGKDAVVEGDEVRATARTRLYRGGVLVKEDFPVSEVSDCVAEDGVCVWIDLVGADGADLGVIANELGLHELAVEDALTTHQRPKLDRYATHDFLNMYDVRFDRDTAGLEFSEISAFATGSALVTVRKDDRFDMDQVVARWDSSPELLANGVGFLLYGLLDHVVDGHFDAIRTLDEEIESLEDMLFSDVPPDRDLQRRSFDLRKGLVLLRRVVLPMREVVNGLMRRDTHLVTPPLVPYYQDLYDHVLRVTEWTESLRDLVTTILETNLTQQGNRLNVITKKVTSWAAIIAVPTAITGWYGQNVPYPGFGNLFGLLASAALIAGASLGLYWTFRRNNWL
jgi:magnesium transporter